MRGFQFLNEVKIFVGRLLAVNDESILVWRNDNIGEGKDNPLFQPLRKLVKFFETNKKGVQEIAAQWPVIGEFLKCKKRNFVNCFFSQLLFPNCQGIFRQGHHPVRHQSSHVVMTPFAVRFG